MTSFDPRFTEWALRPFSVPAEPADGWHVTVRGDLPSDRRALSFELDDGRRLLALSDEAARITGLSDGDLLGDPAPVLSAAGIGMNGPDHYFTFAPADIGALLAEPDPPHVRPLTADDAAAFAAFTAAADAAELDEAYVELDHWAVFGAFDGESLASIASAYPFDDSPVADIGVITLAGQRGKGHARALVRALSRHILGTGLLPLYRCQVDNHASATTAVRAGLSHVGLRDVAPAEGA